MGSHKFDEIRRLADELEDEADKMSENWHRLNDEMGEAEGAAREEIDAAGVRLARELEPLFAAIYRGDLAAARAALGNLTPVLDGSDPILIALQRAKSRPHLYLAPAA